MKKVVFLGMYDKIDMLIYISKIITLMKKKVLLIDTTILKKSRYVVPTMANVEKYISTYENIDVAIGFKNFDEIAEYQEQTTGKVEEYDYAILDIDRAVAYKSFEINPKDLHYFVTSFDLFNLQKGIQLLRVVEHNTSITKIFFTKSMVEEENQYFDFLVQKYNIKWNTQNVVFFPFETSDFDAIYINQRAQKISLKGLSLAYTESIKFLVEEITGEGSSKVKHAFKHVED